MRDMATESKPMSESKPELRIDFIYDSDFNNDEYDKKRKQRNADRHKAIVKAIEDLKPETVYKLAKASLEKDLRRCEIEAMEFEDSPTIDEAYEGDEDDEE